MIKSNNYQFCFSIYNKRYSFYKQMTKRNQNITPEIPTNSIQESQFKLCDHIKKISKAQILSIIQKPAQIRCQTHYDLVTNPTMCLHCNKIFCGFNSKEKCISTHKTLNENHIFSMAINKNHTQQQNIEVHCNKCQAQINFMVLAIQSSNSRNVFQEQLKKINRFIDFLTESNKKIKAYYKQQEQFANAHVSLKGLWNLGNTCFLNCDLQILAHTKSLIQLFSEYKFVKGSFKTSMSSKLKPLDKQIQFFYDEVIEQGQSRVWHIVSHNKQKKHEQNQKFIKTITSCKFNHCISSFFDFMTEKQKQQTISYEDDHYQPIQILDNLSEIDSKYRIKEQQDAQETFLFILDMLIQGQFIGLGYDSQRYNKVEKHIGKQKITPIQRVFGSYLVSQIFCNQCKKTKYTFDLTYHLSINVNKVVPSKKEKDNSIFQKLEIQQTLPMKKTTYFKDLVCPKKQKSDIPALLKSFFCQQILTKRDNFYQCSDCNSLTGYKKFYLADPPQVLMISMKRFDHKMVKNSNFVEFPETIDINSVCLKQSSQEQQQQQQTQKQNSKNEYILYGVIVHLGSTISSGHYICFINKEGHWLRCSDEQVKKVSWRQVKRQQAYILFYQRKRQK